MYTKPDCAHCQKKKVRKAAAALSEAAHRQASAEGARSERAAQQARYALSGLAAAAGCHECLQLTGVPPNPLAVFAAR